MEHVSVVLQRSRLMLGSMPHLQRVLEHGHQLFDLAVVEHPGRDAPFGRQPFQEIHPLGPLPIRWSAYRPLIGFQGYGELVLGHKVKCTLGKTIIHLRQDIVLFLHKEIDGHMREISFLRGDGVGGWPV